MCYEKSIETDWAGEGPMRQGLPRAKNWRTRQVGPKAETKAVTFYSEQ